MSRGEASRQIDRRRRLPRVACLMLALALSPNLARAQSAGPLAGVDIQTAHPTPFNESGIVTDRANLTTPWTYGVQLMGHYALNPLVWRNPDNTETIAVAGQIYAELLANVTFLKWLEAGVALPVALGFFAGDLRGLSAAPSSIGLGDLRLAVKAQVLNQYAHVVNLAVIAEIGVPTGGGRAYYGSSTVTGSPRLVVSRHFGPFELAANLGARLRGGRDFANVRAGSQLTYNAMARWELPWIKAPTVEAIAEVWGLTAAEAPFRGLAVNSLEWLASARLGFVNKIYLTLGVGGGFIPGYGSPDLRAFLGLAFAPRDVDSDHDGLVDRLDRCPHEAETYNGIDDDDGCPEGDRDHDGITDWLDKCPDLPETKNGYQDQDGCPDKPPPPPKKKACKQDEPDEDGNCPDDEPPPPPADDDRDHDGIPTRVDKCPDEPETINGKDDDDGCPDEGEGATVFVSKKEITILQKINFETASAKIKSESFSILDQVALQLRAHLEVKKLRIEGHTDSVGADAYNMKLSQARSESVRAYLLDKGVAAARLVAVGYGETKPIASNATPRGRAQNRRVQFVILEQADQP